MPESVDRPAPLRITTPPSPTSDASSTIWSTRPCCITCGSPDAGNDAIMSTGLFVLRVVIGLLLAGHGAQKLFGRFGGHGLDGTGGFFDSLGFRPGRRMASVAGLSELG